MPTSPAFSLDAQAQYMLARVWHGKGNLPLAIEGYRRVLTLDPGHLGAIALVGDLMRAQLRLGEMIAIYRAALEHHPNNAWLHKLLVNALLAQNGPESALLHYGLSRQDSKPFCPRPEEVLCCTVLRNEFPRLPYFLAYYRKKGIRAFVAVDNGSSDGGLEFLLDQPDVYVWQSEFSFNRANFGASWFESILRMHGKRHWCLMVDADELLYYPECERRSIPDLCRTLDRKGKRAFNAPQLDMYSNQSIEDTHYTPGQAFEEVCPYFDRQFYTYAQSAGWCGNQKAYFGGVRQRIFGGDGYYLSKVPLLKYDDGCILSGGQHWTNLPIDQIAIESGCLLHFKYFSSFGDHVRSESRRKEHDCGAQLYQQYQRVLGEQPALTLYDPAFSVRLEDSAQLLRLGIMQPEENTDPAAE